MTAQALHSQRGQTDHSCSCCLDGDASGQKSWGAFPHPPSVSQRHQHCWIFSFDLSLCFSRNHGDQEKHQDKSTLGENVPFVKWFCILSV